MRIKVYFDEDIPSSFAHALMNIGDKIRFECPLSYSFYYMQCKGYCCEDRQEGLKA